MRGMELSRTWRSIQHPHPQKWPQFFKPESGTPSSHKRGSRGRRLANQGGEVSLPHGEGAHPSGKGGGKHHNQAGVRVTLRRGHLDNKMLKTDEPNGYDTLAQ